MGEKDISYAAYESAMMHMQKINKRLTILIGIVLVFAIMVLASVVYFLSTYEITTESVDLDSQNGAVNYIGNDNNGEINNAESRSQEDNN